jgi:hypothetical protein
VYARGTAAETGCRGLGAVWESRLLSLTQTGLLESGGAHSGSLPLHHSASHTRATHLIHPTSYTNSKETESRLKEEKKKLQEHDEKEVAVEAAESAR